MKAIILQNLIWLGQALKSMELLCKFHQNLQIKGESFLGLGVTNALLNIKQYIDDLEISPETSKEINEIVDTFDKRYKPHQILSIGDKKILEKRSNIWYDRISNESKKIETILLDYNYSLNLSLLKSGSEAFFNEKIWKKLTKSTKKDLDESCKCILFELPTSAGFLALRATESVLRKYYKKKTNKSLTGFINWNDMIKELKSTNADKTLLGHLDYLRKNLRNKLSHPNSHLSQRDAENIFLMIITSIEAMMKDMR